MNKKFSSLLLSLAMLVFLPLTAFGIGFPHDSTQGVGCSSCHTATAFLPENSYVNMCTNCHKPGPSNGFVKSVFYQTDAANIYNHLNNYSSGTTTRPSKAMYTSHNWVGSEVAPEAGALRPTSTKMNTITLGTTLSCARCHNVHGPRSTLVTSAPFLRAKMDNDEMCLDCHRSRSTKDHKVGSHPVGLSYYSSAILNPSGYNLTPAGGSSNTTAAMKLVNGKVSCSTCHKTHFADSNSGTIDSNETWANLSSSRGMLLRTDTFGKTATDVNICTNCHKAVNHNVSGQNIQCADCHTGHVEYVSPADILANPKEATPNAFMLRRYVNISTAAGPTPRTVTRLSTYRKKLVYWNTSSYANTQNTGVCQACHNLPTTISEHSDLATFNNAAECQSCHVGGTHTTDPPIGCTGCHGSPPVHNTAGLNNTMGYAVGTVTTNRYNSTTVFKNESTAGHPTHADRRIGRYSYSCDQCHKGNRDLVNVNHDAGNNTAAAFQWLYQQSGMIANTGTSIAPIVTTTYTGATGTCTSVYCHSNGISRVGITGKKYKTVTWANSNNTIIGTGNRCVACHNGIFSTFNTMSSNAHTKHALTFASGFGKGYTCNLCHSATITSTDNLTISTTSKHSDGVADVSMSGTFGGTLTVNGSWVTATATCSTSYCHSNGKGTYSTPSWINRSSGACGTCHAASSPMIATYGHFSHISSAGSSDWGPGLKGTDVAICGKCHTYTTALALTHVNGTIDTTNANCTTACHRNNGVTPPTWTDAARLTCQSCHDGNVSYDVRFTNISAPRKVLTTFTNLGHGQFNAYACTQCHSNTSKHISGVRGDTNRLGVYEANENGLCNSCHSNAVTVPTASYRDLPTHVTAHDATANANCSTCHDVHGTSNYASVIASIKYKANSSAVIITKPASTTGFINNTTKRGLCQVCHTVTNHYRRGVTEPVNGFSGSGTNHTTFTGAECLNCHKHTGGYAFVASGGSCNGCHGYPPLPKSYVKGVGNYNSGDFEDYSGAGGSHVVAGHVPKSADPAKTWDLCNSCHSISDHNMGGNLTKAVQIKNTVSTKLRMNPAILPKYSSNRLDGGLHTVGTCSNVSCHFQRTLKWGMKP